MIRNNTNYVLGLENFIYLTILNKKRQKRVRDQGHTLQNVVISTTYFMESAHMFIYNNCTL